MKEQSTITQVDFRQHTDEEEYFSIDLNTYRLKKAIFPESGLRGLVAHTSLSAKTPSRHTSANGYASYVFPDAYRPSDPANDGWHQCLPC